MPHCAGERRSEGLPLVSPCVWNPPGATHQVSTARRRVPVCSHLGLVAAYRGLCESVGLPALSSWPCCQSLTGAPLLVRGGRTLKQTLCHVNQLRRTSRALPPRAARSRGAPPARHRGGIVAAPRTAHRFPSKPIAYRNNVWMGVLDLCVSHPIPHRNNVWMGF